MLTYSRDLNHARDTMVASNTTTIEFMSIF
jgi:hypothetical protein